MKGPKERLKYDLRRVWECPNCHHRERTSGSLTSRTCGCQDDRGTKRIVMRLVEDGVRRQDGVRGEDRKADDVDRNDSE